MSKMHKKPKILFVHQANGLGGAVKSLSLILLNLDQEKYEPFLFLPGDDVQTVDFFAGLGIPTHTCQGLVTFGDAYGVSLGFSFWKPWTFLIFWRRFFHSVSVFRDFLTEHQPDLIYLNTAVLTPYGLAAKQCSIKVIWHIREEIRKSGFQPWAWLTRKIIRACANRIICISQVNKQKLGIPSAEVIYNYASLGHANLAEAVQMREKQVGVEKRPFVLAMLGGTVWSKGLPTLLRAMAQVCSTDRHVRLIVAGHPIRPDTMTYVDKVKNLLRRQKDTSHECHEILRTYPQLAEKVSFLGFQKDVGFIISGSDVLIWPGRVSHFARPIMEAFSLGKPVIASDFESSREIVSDGRNGLLFQPENAVDLSRKIMYLVNNPALMKQMGGGSPCFCQAAF